MSSGRGMGCAHALARSELYLPGRQSETHRGAVAFCAQLWPGNPVDRPGAQQRRRRQRQDHDCQSQRVPQPDGRGLWLDLVCPEWRAVCQQEQRTHHPGGGATRHILGQPEECPERARGHRKQVRLGRNSRSGHGTGLRTAGLCPAGGAGGRGPAGHGSRPAGAGVPAQACACR